MLNLDDLVSVTISLSGLPAQRGGFQTACLLGASDVIPTSERVRLYASASAMLTDGFTATSPEYLAATKYFSQSPKPAKVLIGRAVPTAVGNETQETWAEAAAACVEASAGWYLLYPCAALSDSEITAVAAAMETGDRVLVYDTAASAVLAGTAGNLFLALKALGYERTLGLYSADAYAGAALCGFAMGANDGTASSAYTLCYKPLAGVTADVLTAAQLAAVKAANGNAYVNRAGTYSTLEKGVMASGEPFDTRLNIDQLSANIRLAVTDLLCGTRTKIPQTESGMTQLKAAIAAECQKAVRAGFLGDGVWTEEPLLELARGDAIAGFRVMSEPVDGQTEAERASRQAPAVYVALKLSGAVETVVVKVVVDR